MEFKQFTAHGKLLLFGEYLVLRGSSCLAIPLQFGQELRISQHNGKSILWESKDQENPWLMILFSPELAIIHATDMSKAEIIQKLLFQIKTLNPTINWSQIHFSFNTNFNREYGFGTSSTLISLLSQWTEVNPYLLLNNSFGGSGYDIAAATTSLPFTYTINDKITKSFVLPKEITDKLLFVYLGKKQQSSREIIKFQSKQTSENQINQMNEIVKKAITCTSIEAWENLIDESENLLSSILETPKVKDLLFSDYSFSIKSLGAWGGDFIMATCRDINVARDYFINNGHNTLYSYNELIK